MGSLRRGRAGPSDVSRLVGMSASSHGARIQGSPLASRLHLGRQLLTSFLPGPTAGPLPQRCPPRGCDRRGVGGSVETRNSTCVFPWSWPAFGARLCGRVWEVCGPACQGPVPISVGSDSMRREEARVFYLTLNRAGILQLCLLPLLTRGKRWRTLGSLGDAILPLLTIQF